MKKSLMAIVGIAAASVLAAPLTASAQVPDPLPSESITDLAVATPELSTLVTAVTAAGLADTLADCTAGPFTVFAPTDAAFAALPADVLNAALADPSGLLTQVLTYHVVPGILDAATVVGSTSQTTLQGEAISVNGAVLNGSVNITATDIFACNGVVHLIDAVLLPPSIANPPVAEDLPETGATTYVMLLIGGVLVMAGFGLTRVRRHTV
jgi:LPXTG-motif cell wall-anchored protein